MKFIPLIFILLIAIVSCKESKEAPSSTLEEKIELAKYELTDQSEKILLLSTIKKISYDSLSNILRDFIPQHLTIQALTV